MTLVSDGVPEDAISSGDLDLERLSSFLEQHVGGFAGPLSASLVPGGRSNPTYALTDTRREWILRRPPLGELLQSTHDMGREQRVVSALAPTAVPVPTIVAACDDPSVIGAPFYVMNRLAGRTLRDQADTSTLTVAQRRNLSESMIAALVELHSLDPAEVGLSDFGRPEGYLERQLSRWGRQWEAVRTSDRAEVAIILDRLTRALPASASSGIVHGDFKIDNIMVDLGDPSRIVGVLDWEMSTLGDPLSDVGILLSFWDQPGEMFNPITAGATAQIGFPSRDEMIELYAARVSADIPDIEWYLVFADFKIAVVLEQIHARHQAGNATGDVGDIGDMVGPLLDRALENARRARNVMLHP